MFVCDEDAVQPFWRARNAGEFLPDLSSAESGVDEEPDFAGFEIGAVAAGTAAENRELDRHARENKMSAQSNQLFFERNSDAMGRNVLLRFFWPFLDIWSSVGE